VRDREAPLRPDQTLTPEASLFVSATSLRHRWTGSTACAGAPSSCLVAAVTVLGSVTIIPLPVGPMLAVAGTLALMNLGYVARNRLFAARAVRTEIRIVKLEMACDLLLLTFVTEPDRRRREPVPLRLRAARGDRWRCCSRGARSSRSPGWPSRCSRPRCWANTWAGCRTTTCWAPAR
jgi:hypothetical protein